MGELLVLSKEVTHFTTTNTDVTSRNVFIRTDYSIQFVHECLTETHNLCIALATWREIGTTFGTTHRKCCQRVLKSLFKSEKLQNSQIYTLVVTQTAFVRTNGVVVLHAIAHVGLHVALVVYP